MLTFQVSKEPAWVKNLPEVEIKSKKLEDIYYIPAQFKIVEGSKAFVLYAKDTKGEEAIKGLNNVLATCEKVKNDVGKDTKIDDKTKQALIKNINTYEKDVIGKVKEYTTNSEFVGGAELYGPKDVFLRLGGKGEEKEVAAKAFDLIEKYPALKPLEKFSYYGTGGSGNAYLTGLTHSEANAPSKHIETRETKNTAATKSGSEYGKSIVYELDGVSVNYTPTTIVKK